jgi:hypothetical protein
MVCHCPEVLEALYVAADVLIVGGLLVAAIVLGRR